MNKTHRCSKICWNIGHRTEVAPDYRRLQRTTAGGLLALPTNIVAHSGNRFAVLPEFGNHGTVLLTGRLSLACGYSLIL